MDSIAAAQALISAEPSFLWLLQSSAKSSSSPITQTAFSRRRNVNERKWHREHWLHPGDGLNGRLIVQFHFEPVPHFQSHLPRFSQMIRWLAVQQGASVQSKRISTFVRFGRNTKDTSRANKDVVNISAVLGFEIIE